MQKPEAGGERLELFKRHIAVEMQGETLREEITREGKWCSVAKGDVRIVEMKRYGCEAGWMCLLRVAWSERGVNGSNMQRGKDYRVIHSWSADGKPIDREAA